MNFSLERESVVLLQLAGYNGWVVWMNVDEKKYINHYKKNIKNKRKYIQTEYLEEKGMKY